MSGIDVGITLLVARDGEAARLEGFRIDAPTRVDRVAVLDAVAAPDDLRRAVLGTNWGGDAVEVDAVTLATALDCAEVRWVGRPPHLSEEAVRDVVRLSRAIHDHLRAGTRLRAFASTG